MKLTIQLLTALLWATVVSGFIRSERRRGTHVSFSSSSSSAESSSSSSSSSEEHHKHHHHSHRRPRPTQPPPVPPCEGGWTTFDRPQGRWCVRVYIASGNYDAGQAFCGAQGAVLTGIQNATERQILADLALTEFKNSGSGERVASTWIGAKRTVDRTFVWTDGHTTGTDGFKWGTTQPDLQVMNGLVQSCVQQFIITPAYWAAPGWGQMFQHGDLDDWYCPVFTGFAPNFRMYACGKKPSA